MIESYKNIIEALKNLSENNQTYTIYYSNLQKELESKNSE